MLARSTAGVVTRNRDGRRSTTAVVTAIDRRTFRPPDTVPGAHCRDGISDRPSGAPRDRRPAQAPARITVEIVAQVLSRAIDDLEPTLSRDGAQP